MVRTLFISVLADYYRRTELVAPDKSTAPVLGKAGMRGYTPVPVVVYATDVSCRTRSSIVGIDRRPVLLDGDITAVAPIVGGSVIATEQQRNLAVGVELGYVFDLRHRGQAPAAGGITVFLIRCAAAVGILEQHRNGRTVGGCDTYLRGDHLVEGGIAAGRIVISQTSGIAIPILEGQHVVAPGSLGRAVDIVDLQGPRVSQHIAPDIAGIREYGGFDDIHTQVLVGGIAYTAGAGPKEISPSAFHRILAGCPAAVDRIGICRRPPTTGSSIVVPGIL